MNGLLSVLSEFWVGHFSQTLWIRSVALSKEVEVQSAIPSKWQSVAEACEAMLGDFTELWDLRREQSIADRWTMLIDCLGLLNIFCGAFVLLIFSLFDSEIVSSAPPSHHNPDSFLIADTDVLPVSSVNDDNELPTPGIQ